MDLAHCQHAQSIGGGVIVRIVLMLPIRVGVMMIIGSRFVIMLVLVMNEPGMFQQSVR